MNEWGPWTPAEYPPSRSGRYLVAQRKEGKRYRWIRYFNGDGWANPKLDEYGEIYCWMELPDYPTNFY